MATWDSWKGTLAQREEEQAMRALCQAADDWTRAETPANTQRLNECARAYSKAKETRQQIRDADVVVYLKRADPTWAKRAGYEEP